MMMVEVEFFSWNTPLRSHVWQRQGRDFLHQCPPILSSSRARSPSLRFPRTCVESCITHATAKQSTR